MVPTTPLTHPLATLSSLHLTLHHLHHRNKNQHRLAKWYKSLTQFLRQTAKLAGEIEGFEGARGVDPGYGRKDGKGKKDGGKEGKVRKESKFTIAAREKLVARLEFLALGSRGDMVGRWYLAFSTLVADNQYASLGLMLIGSLARFQTVVKQVAKEIGLDLEPREIPVQEEAGLVLLRERMSYDGGVDDLGEVVPREGFEPAMLEARHDGGLEDDEDEVVLEIETKKEVEGVVVDEKEGDVEIERKSSAKEKKRKGVGERIEVGEPSKAKKSKKKKKGDAFDDLFGSLI